MGVWNPGPAATEGDDIYTGDSTSETIDGLGGADDLFGLGGDDTLVGGLGVDLLVGGLGSDTLDGGFDADIASYQDIGDTVALNGVGVSVSLLLTGAQNTGAGGTDTLISIESLIGSQYADVLTGDDNFNVLNGARGDDVLNGGGGHDHLMGGAGNDTLNGGDGLDTANYRMLGLTFNFHDRIPWPQEPGLGVGVTVSLLAPGPQDTLGAGVDTLTSIENLTGSQFRDTLTGNDGANVLIGEAGNDVIFGGPGSDTIDGGDGNDLLDAGQLGGPETDYVDGRNGTDTASFRDSPGVSVSLAASGSQWTGVGTVTLVSIEDLRGSDAGADVLTGSGGRNVLSGLGGDDILIGGGGNGDILEGGAGSDQLYGQAGFDMLYDGGETTNRDFLYGGSGNDYYYVTSSLIGPLDLVYEGGTNPDLMAGVGDIDRIYSQGSFFWDYYGVAELLFIDTGAGSQIVGGTNGQEITGGAGSDQIIAYGGSNRVDAGAGSDAISFGLYGLADSFDGVNTVVMKAGSGMDYVYDFESGVDKIDLTAFNFGITGAQVLAQAVNVDNAGVADDYAYFYLTSAGGVDNFIVFMGLQSSGLQAGDFITGTV